MKHYIILYSFLIVFTSSLAQKTVSGYYITKNNDTIETEIKIRKGVFGQITNDFTKSIEVTDGSNKSLEFTPDDIKGYGDIVVNACCQSYKARKLDNDIVKELCDK